MLAKFRRSKKALAIPVTFLILFVSTIGMISVTYYLAIDKVNTRSQTIKVATAKQDFVSLEQDISAVLWQPGSARVVKITDSGGRTNIEPANNTVLISISDNSSLNEIIYNQTTGWIRYELPYTDAADTGLYLKGDSRTISNSSGASATQLYITNGDKYVEIRLQYRPIVSYTTASSENGRPINNIRIYVVNMNSSDSVSLHGELPFRISCESTQISKTKYTITYAIDKLEISSIINQIIGESTVSISSTSEGAIINLEIVECNIKIERSIL